MDNVRIQIVKVREDEYYLCVESPPGSFFQIIGTKKEVLEAIRVRLEQ